jgi:hypothetical protein
MTTTSKVATVIEKCNLHDAERAAIAEGAVREKLEAMLSFACGDAQELELHEIERTLFAQVLSLGRSLLEVSLATRGTGRVAGGVIEAPTGEELPYHSTRTLKKYEAIFGTIEIQRAYYWRAGAEAGYYPLDAELNLPEQCYSYLLQEWGELLGVDGSYEKVTARLEGILGVKFWTQGVQRVARAASADVQPFYEQKQAPASETEAEILVATIDGKGVPIRGAETRGKKLRLGTGEKNGKKKEAVVTAVYTVDPHWRSPEDVIREIDDDNCVVRPDPEPAPRPRPQGKIVRATLNGKDEAFREVQRQLEQRDPDGKKQRIALTDGAEALQERVLRELGGQCGIVLILDIMHVLTYLWPVAFCYHKDGSPEASRWVMHKLRLLMEGKVGYVIGGLRQRVNQGDLSRRAQKTFESAIRYMDRNRDYMAYDVYLSHGFPIGSGVVEGACKHLVKDRMECTGMRWNVDGAQAILELRAVEINGDWQDFWRYHVAQQRLRLYGQIPARREKNAA